MSAELSPYRFRYHPALDGVRALAAFLVFLLHIPYGPTLFTGGHIGVDMFLVLSGFLITSILVAEWDNKGRISLSRFYARRLLRLSPAVLFCAGIMVAYELWGRLTTVSEAANYLMALVFYYVNLTPFLGIHIMTGMLHTWSLSLEEQFYMVWPVLLIGLLSRSRRTALVGTCILFTGLTLWECWLSAHDTSLNNRLFLCLDTRSNAALCGAIAALVPWTVDRATLDRLAMHVSRGLYVWLAVIFTCFFLLPHPNNGLRQPMVLPAILASGLLIFTFAFGPDSRERHWFERPWMVQLGRLSYSFYVWHLPVIYVIGCFWMPRNTRLEQSLVELPASLLCAWLSYRFVETPFLRLKQKYSSA